MAQEYLIGGLPATSGHSGCLLCRTCEEAEQLWLRWFLTANHSDPALLRSLYGSVGFCPAHNRRLFAEAAPPVLRRPLVYALRGAVARLEPLAAVRRPGRRQRKPAARSCPLCRVIMERERAAAEDVAVTLVQPDTAAVLADRDGLCCRHLAGLLPRFSVAQAAVAAEIVAGRLAALRAGAPESLLVLAGLDADALARVPYLTAHARLLREEPHAGARSVRVSPASYLIADLAAGSCPVCRAAGREQVRYLLWLGNSLAEGGGSAGAGLQLCARHLLDARHLHDDGAAARTGSWLVRVVSASSYAQAVTLAAAAREVLAAPRPGRRRRDGSLSRGSADRAGETFGAAVRAMAGDRSCRACWVGLDAERRQLSLLHACLLDTGVLRAVGDAHGLCLRHAALIAADGDARPVLSRLMTQLRQAQWELDEGAAKRAWDRRHEPKGHEQDAWRRVPALIDGAVDLGIPVSGRDHRHGPTT